MKAASLNSLIAFPEKAMILLECLIVEIGIPHMVKMQHSLREQ